MSNVYYKDIENEIEELRQKAYSKSVGFRDTLNNVNDYSTLKYERLYSKECLTEDDPKYIIDSLNEFLDEIKELKESKDIYFGTFTNEIYADYELSSIAYPYIEYEYSVKYTDGELEEKRAYKESVEFKNEICNYFDIPFYKWQCQVYKMFERGNLTVGQMKTLMVGEC